jgi:hypothetical protein
MVTPRLSVEFPWQEPLVNSALVVSWVPVQSAPRHEDAVPAWTVPTRALAAKAKTAREKARMTGEPASISWGVGAGGGGRGGKRESEERQEPVASNVSFFLLAA